MIKFYLQHLVELTTLKREQLIQCHPLNKQSWREIPEHQMIPFALFS